MINSLVSRLIVILWQKNMRRLFPGAGIVTEDLAQNGKSYKTSEVGQWIADYIKNK